LSLAPRLVAVASLAALAGCDDMTQFSTADGESYCGVIARGGAFRAGLSPRVQMRLTLDAAKLDGAGSPGTVSTYEAADGESPERRLLDGAALRQIPPLSHDPLSRPVFGDGRERNAIYAVSAAEPGAESMLAILSLQTDDSVEVRLLRAGAEAGPSGEAPPVERRQIFGVFRLTRRRGTCGF
jgi:hypothetical protein